MNYSSSNFSHGRGFPAGNPIANALVIIVGALVIGASIVLGFFAFVLLATLLIIFSAIVGLRLWWFDRRLKKAAGGKRGDASQAGAGNNVIEGEYRVVVEERDDSQDRAP